MTIFSNYNIDHEALREEFQEHLQINGFEPEEIEQQLNDNNALYEYGAEMESMWFDDECRNLDVDIESNIIALATVQTWQGSRQGYKVLGTNLKEVFNCWNSCDYIEVYTEKNNVYGKGTHHDGTNHVMFRKFREGLSEEQIDTFLSNVFCEKVTDKQIQYYTRSLYYDVKKVYG